MGRTNEALRVLVRQRSDLPDRRWLANHTALTLSDINGDGAIDLLGRSGPAGDLDAFTHRGTFTPTAPLNTFGTPVRVGTNYNQYNVIS